VSVTVVDEPLAPGLLTGTVFDKRGAIVVNARVSLPGITAVVTDEFGRYRFENLAPVDRIAVTAERSEFFPNSAIVAIRSDRETQQDIILSRPVISQTIDTDAGGEVAGDGLSLDVPANIQLVSQSGEAVSGAVEFRASYFQSTNVADMAEFPGDTIATNDQGTTGSLVSFGFIKLDIVDPLGDPLEIAEGQSIPVSIAADPSLDNPPTIPFWSFDEIRGEWVQEGVAVLDPVTNTYQAAVDRVATFNLDLFFDVIASIELCLVDDQGNPVPGFIGIEPLDKSFRSVSETSEGGTLSLRGIIGERAFNLYGVSRDGRVGAYSENPYFIEPGDNTLPECVMVQNDQLTSALSISGNIAFQGDNPTPDADVIITVFGDADGEFQGAPSRIEIASLPVSSAGEFSLNTEATSPLSVELAMFGDKTITLKASSGSSRGETELYLQNGVTEYSVPDVPVFPNIPPRAFAGADD